MDRVKGIVEGLHCSNAESLGSEGRSYRRSSQQGTERSTGKHIELRAIFVLLVRRLAPGLPRERILLNRRLVWQERLWYLTLRERVSPDVIR